VFAASAASAQPPYEPDETLQQGTYPDEPGYDDPSGGGGSSDGGSSTSAAPLANGGTGSSWTGSTWDQDLGTDIIKLTDSGIDFGDNTWLFGAPIGFGSVEWAIVDGFYTPRLIGTLHLDGVSGKFGRMHISYWSGGELIDIRHGQTRHATDDGHWHWPVDISPANPAQITEVHVCTEISDDGVDFGTVNCKTRLIG
jgi:hypothetical protein